MADAKTGTGLRESQAAVAFLSNWIADQCRGGPWKALEPLGTIAGFLAALEVVSENEPVVLRALERIAEITGRAS